MDKYLITGTVRRDGSSKFAPNHQYGVFPSGSIAWKVKEESFMKSIEAITDLKIRASYGEVGNQNSVGLFQYLSSYTPGGPVNSQAPHPSSCGKAATRLEPTCSVDSSPSIKMRCAISSDLTAIP